MINTLIEAVKRRRRLIVDVLRLAFPFLAMDAAIRILGMNIAYFRPSMIVPNLLFTCLWIGLPIALTVGLKRTAARAVYSVFFAVFYLSFVVHSVYYPLTGYFFNFSLMNAADEGRAYMVDALTGAGWFSHLMIVLLPVLFAFAVRRIPIRPRYEIRRLLIAMVVFVLLHLLTPLCLGSANSGLEWDTWRNPRNVYNNFNDSNKCMKICGLFEYTVRDFCLTFLSSDEPDNPEDIAFLEQHYASPTTHSDNAMTGIFEGKNVIFLQLEGMDSWMLTEETTPHLYRLMNSGINFTDHYSYYSGGGSTFNSELAVNTGFITPMSYTRNPYSFTTNVFSQSMPRLFKERGYRVNAFHMNTEEYYSRGLNYKNWGYDHYYGLIDLCQYDDVSYELDRELIDNPTFYELMFNGDEPFVNYIITYTPHTPFANDKGVGELLATELHGENAPTMTEEQVALMYAGETDRMVGQLMDALKTEGLYDDTVIVAYADHYLYSLNDKTVLEQYKTTDDHRINHTPFFIWSGNAAATTVDKTNSQLDILPTVLNLFGFAYTQEYYMGQDIFDDAYDGYVVFSDYSWYDGTVYYDTATGNVHDKSEQDLGIDIDAVKATDAAIKTMAKVNDLTLQYDFFRRMKTD